MSENPPFRPENKGQNADKKVTAQGSKPEFDYGYARNPCLKRPHLERTVKQQGWCETSGSQPFYATGETVFDSTKPL